MGAIAIPMCLNGTPISFATYFYAFQLSLPFTSYRKVFGQMCVLTNLHTAALIQDSMASHHIPRCSYIMCVLLLICDWI